MIPQPTSAFLYWDGNTLNTPFKHGATMGAEGMALVSGSYNGYQTVFAIPRGDTALYIHCTNDGVPTGWKRFALT